MMTLLFALGLGMVMVGVGWGEETSAHRLEAAQRGMAEPSWPKKPDHRLSPLSGKMKNTPQISPKFYNQDKEFRVRPLKQWNQESRWSSATEWKPATGQGWEEMRWKQDRDHSEADQKKSAFQPKQESGELKILAHRNLGQVRGPDWAARTSRLGWGEDGGLRIYQGRLQRVREQVWREEQVARELGPGRQEKFRPEEVEKILSQPAGEFRGEFREQSPAASPLAAADN